MIRIYNWLGQNIDGQLEAALKKQADTWEPIYFPANDKAYILNEFHTTESSAVRLVGEGPHTSRIVMGSSRAGILVDQRQADYKGWSCNIQDLGIDVLPDIELDAPALSVYGQGTENKMASHCQIHNVQFGPADKRSPPQGGEKRKRPTPTWLALSGTIGMQVTNCNFTGHWYYGGAVAGIRFTSNAGVIEDIEGSSHVARSMKCTIKNNCQFFVMMTAILVDPDAWIEGLRITGNQMVDVGTGVLVLSDGTHGGGTLIDVIDNHIAFRQTGIVIEQGVADIRGNYLLPLPHWEYEEDSAHVVLGAPYNTEPIKAQLSRVAFNNFGMVDLKNLPEVAVLIYPPSRKIRVHDNFVQGGIPEVLDKSIKEPA